MDPTGQHVQRGAPFIGAPGLCRPWLAAGWRRLFLLCAGSGAIGVLAWGDAGSLLPLSLLLLLPALIFQSGSRLGALLVAASYYGVATRAVPGIVNGFFPSWPAQAGLGLWLGQAVVLSLPWMVGYAHPAASVMRRAWGVVTALLVLTLPPVGLFHWGSPLMSAGLLFPGWRWVGVVLALGFVTALAVGVERCRAARAVALGVGMLALLANLGHRAPMAPMNWHAVSLEWGRSPGLWSDEMAARRDRLIERAWKELSFGARVVVFPESIAGSNRRRLSENWRRLAAFAKAQGATVLIGEEHSQPGPSSRQGGFRNALVGYGEWAGQGDVVVSSRVPMPVGDWKFGGEDGAQTDVFGDDVVRLADRDVAFSLCYEDFLLWPHRGLLSGRATVLISAANQWPSSGTSAETAQDVSRAALARLSGVALLTAKNR